MKKYIKYLILLSVFLIISCTTNNTQINKKADAARSYSNDHLDIENQVIWALLESEYRRTTEDTIYNQNGKIVEIFKHEKPPKPNLLIINETTSISYDSSDSTFYSLKDLGLSLLTTKMLHDFCSRNKSSIKVGPFDGFDGDITYASLAEAEHIISVEINGKVLGPIKPQDNYYTLRTTSKEHVRFSRPGFNDNQTLAIIEYSTYSGPISSANQLLILGKVNGKWKILERAITLIS
jgi:hypothetical protein